MRIGYEYLRAIWPSIADCDEIELSVYQEVIYNFGLRRIADSPDNWRDRVNRFEKELLKTAREQRPKCRIPKIIMD